MTFIEIEGLSIIMLLFMREMYKNKVKNAIIIINSILRISVSTYLIRKQTPINDIR